MKIGIAQVLLAALALGFSTSYAQNVKITPLGSHAGELCDRDRATIFEDPNGVRILYDPGQSVTGGEDARLGDVHVVLLSHSHGDHMGDRKMKALGAGTCAKPDTVPAAPNSTIGEIAAAKNSVIFMIGPMAAFVGKKVANIRGKPTENCPMTEELSVPMSDPCVAGVNLGGTRAFKTSKSKNPVTITTVPASHDSTVARDLLTDPERKNLEVDNVSLYLGPPSGYVIRFSNGLTAYLSGDTAIHADMKAVVADFHKPNLVVFNLGLSAVTTSSAAYAINDVVKPTAVVVTHVNENATADGKLRPDSRTAAFIDAVKGRPVYLAVSGKTMEFDGSAKCVSGC